MNKNAVSFRAIADANILMHPKHHTHAHTHTHKGIHMRIVNDGNTIYKRERRVRHSRRNNSTTVTWSREQVNSDDRKVLL